MNTLKSTVAVIAVACFFTTAASAQVPPNTDSGNTYLHGQALIAGIDCEHPQEWTQHRKCQNFFFEQSTSAGYAYIARTKELLARIDAKDDAARKAAQAAADDAKSRAAREPIQVRFDRASQNLDTCLAAHSKTHPEIMRANMKQGRAALAAVHKLDGDYSRATTEDRAVANLQLQSAMSEANALAMSVLYSDCAAETDEFIDTCPEEPTQTVHDLGPAPMGVSGFNRFQYSMTKTACNSTALNRAKTALIDHAAQP